MLLFRASARFRRAGQFRLAKLGGGKGPVACRLFERILLFATAEHAANLAEEAHIFSTIQAAVSMPSSPSLR